MKMKPILVTGVGGTVGGLGQKIVRNLLDARLSVRALVYRNKDVAQELERQGVEVVMGNLTALHDVHRAIDGCERMYFGMAVSEKYLEATVNVAAVAKHYAVKALVNMSQMTVSQMSITETTPSPQQKLHWLSEQVLNWSGLPIVHVRPTIFMEAFYFMATPMKRAGEMRVPFGQARSSPIAASDVALAVSKILLNPPPHIGKIYQLTGPQSQTMEQIAEEYSRGFGKKISYVDIPFEEWWKEFAPEGFRPHAREHIGAMAALHKQNRYDRYTEDFKDITGRDPITIEEWVSAMMKKSAR
jgi:uncharacterized protein YbjT (DUF2867 family)